MEFLDFVHNIPLLYVVKVCSSGGGNYINIAKDNLNIENLMQTFKNLYKFSIGGTTCHVELADLMATLENLLLQKQCKRILRYFTLTVPGYL